jgi:uncharacterized membrane protein YvbJ
LTITSAAPTQTQAATQTSNTQSTTQSSTPTDIFSMLQQNGILLLAGVLILVLIVALVALSRRRKTSPTPSAAAGMVYCSQCGTQNPTANEFCGKCGNKIR